TGEVKDWLDDHPGMKDSVEAASDCPRGLFKALIAAVHYEGMRLDPKHTSWWIDALCSGEGLTEHDPVHRLRARLNLGGKRPTIKRIEQSALLIKSWNLSRRGEVVKTLAW